MKLREKRRARNNSLHYKGYLDYVIQQKDRRGEASSPPQYGGHATKPNKFTEAMENLTLVEAYYNRSPMRAMLLALVE